MKKFVSLFFCDLTKSGPRSLTVDKYDVPYDGEYIDVVATDGSFHVGAKNEYSASSEFILLSTYIRRKQDV